ncbi:MAG: hydrogenase maturation protease [Candidatus Omnitrophica bacterium]|nr:hydrogenase maturation protease [Candidatus Omnitrophota bacterium]
MSLNGDKPRNILVIGVGNPMRSDDGVGPYVVECIEARRLKGVKVRVTQQLHVEDLESMLDFEKVILVDASVAGQPIDIRQVKGTKDLTVSSSHHLSPAMYVSLAQSIYKKDLPLQLCSVRGDSFEVGDKISPHVLACAKEAVELICSLIES